LAEGRDHAASLVELGLGQLCIAHEAVQVLHRSGHDLPEARVLAACQLGQHRGGHVLLSLDDHRGVSLR
jgi:hypothetical protein